VGGIYIDGELVGVLEGKKYLVGALVGALEGKKYKDTDIDGDIIPPTKAVPVTLWRTELLFVFAICIKILVKFPDDIDEINNAVCALYCIVPSLDLPKTWKVTP
jgi:hypothetical protein